MRKMTLLAAAVAASTLLAGCTTFDAYTGEKKVSSTTKGAALGAAIGALGAYVDSRDDDRRTRQERMLKAAGVGAIAGGGVGAYMDNQEKKLREQLESTGVRVVRNGDNITLVMPGNITFASGKIDIQPSFLPTLDSVMKVVKEFDKTILEVAGHTDSDGPDDANMTLSNNRANAVANYLRQGVKPERLTTVGYGETRPVADNATPEGKAMNRRVELTLLPIKE